MREVDMKLTHQDAVACSPSRHVLRTAPPGYVQLYGNYSLRVFWAAVGILFLFNMAMPVEALPPALLVKMEPDDDKSFNEGSYTLNTYGNIDNSPIPVLGYLKDLEMKLNEQLKSKQGESARSGVGENNQPYEEIMRLLKSEAVGNPNNRIIESVSFHRERRSMLQTTVEVPNVAATSVEVVNVATATSQILLTATVMGKEHIVDEQEKLSPKDAVELYNVEDVMVSATFLKTVDAKPAVNTVRSKYRTTTDPNYRVLIVFKVGALSVEYHVEESQSSFVKHVMAYALEGMCAMQMFMARVETDAAVGKMLIAAGLFYNPRRLLGTAIGKESTLDIEAEVKVMKETVDKLMVAIIEQVMVATSVANPRQNVEDSFPRTTDGGEHNDKNCEEQKALLAHIRAAAADFNKSSYTLNTYGNIENSPIPVRGYLQDLEMKLNEQLKSKQGESAHRIGVGENNHYEEIMRRLKMGAVENLDKIIIESVAFEVGPRVDVGTSALVCTAKLTAKDDVDVYTVEDVMVSATFLKTVDAKPAVKTVPSKFLKTIDDGDSIATTTTTDYRVLIMFKVGPWSSHYHVEEPQSSFVTHVMPYALEGNLATEMYMARVETDAAVGEMLIAAGLVDNDGVSEVVGMAIGKEVVGDIGEVSDGEDDDAVQKIKLSIKYLLTNSTQAPEPAQNAEEPFHNGPVVFVFTP
eukprot:GHVS01074559.1.p1 GENE.GHVS01074559.1~~GHVS01074559.1.p1  ORF type:complete len:693 (+),score=106.19 GHVS01074559.1:440-2518(+)